MNGEMNYKVEYERKCVELEKLEVELEKLEEEYRSLREDVQYRENEAKVMRAQINMVQLIFGGRNR